MSPDTLNSFFALAIGFALAGTLTNGYQAFLRRPVGFRLLQRGPLPTALATVPFLMFAAPFIIMRNMVRARARDRSHIRFVMMATVLSGIWSLMSGTCVVMGLQAVGLLNG